MQDDIYGKEVLKQRRKNMRRVKSLLEESDKDLLKKISNASARYQLSVHVIKTSIMNEEPMALAYFSKDPVKQKIHEKIAGECIQNIQGIRNFKDLGHSELFVSNGQVVTREYAKLSPTKSIDFYFEYEYYKIYVSHKHTEQSGGAQDNQYKDLQGFIDACRDNNDKNKVFIVIADGEYYLGNDARSGTTRMENLKSKCTQSVRVCTIYELEDVLGAIKGETN